MAYVFALSVQLLWLFRRPLVAATFDEGFAQATGQRPTPIGLALAALAAFEAVGAIIVVAMFVCPPAAARLMTDRLWAQVGLSLAFPAISATLGYVLAGYGPLWLRGEHSVSAAGMVAVVSGAILGLAAAFWPRRRRGDAAES